MDKIASPQDLQTELRRIMAYCQGSENPSRDVLASELRELADRVAVAPEYAPEYEAVYKHLDKELRALGFKKLDPIRWKWSGPKSEIKVELKPPSTILPSVSDKFEAHFMAVQDRRVKERFTSNVKPGASIQRMVKKLINTANEWVSDFGRSD